MPVLNTDRAFDRIPTFLDILEDIVSMCFFQERLQSITTPRNLVDLTSLIVSH